MSEHITALLVVFDQPIHEEDVEAWEKSIQLLHRVKSVTRIAQTGEAQFSMLAERIRYRTFLANALRNLGNEVLTGVWPGEERS